MKGVSLNCFFFVSVVPEFFFWQRIVPELLLQVSNFRVFAQVNYKLYVVLLAYLPEMK